MFGCIGRLVVAGLLVACGVAAWLTRDRWEPPLRAKLGLPPAAAPKAPAWEPVTVEGAARARAAIAGMRSPSGPSFTNVKAGDFVAYALDGALRGWSAGAKPPEALAMENEIAVRGTVHLKDLGADAGPLKGLLEGDQAIEVRGRPEVDSTHHAVFHVERISAGKLVVPPQAIGAILSRLAPSREVKGDARALPLALPAEVADIRVTRGRVTLYKGGT